MRFFPWSALASCAALLVGCATPSPRYFSPPVDHVPVSEVRIESRFTTVKVSKERLGLEVNKCVPQLSPDAQSIRISQDRLPSGDILGFGHASSSRLFVLRGTTGFCLQRSSEDFPIFAAEVLVDTVNPEGVPPDVVDGWYKRIAWLIAVKGTAKIAYALDNGNAHAVTYWADKGRGHRLRYSRLFKKAGEWSEGDFDAKLTYPTMTSVSETQRSGVSQKSYPLSHRSM